VLATPDSSNVTFLGHETGHTFGWGHSFDDTTRKNSDWSAPGEYFDYWDIMSAMAVYDFAHPQGVVAGPEMNAPYKTKQGFIPAHRITRLVPGARMQTWRSNVAAINRPEGNGSLMVRVGNDDNYYYTVEYRMPSGWDQAIPRATVLVHRVTNGTSVLITANSGPERLVGSVSSYPLGGRNVTVHVNGFAAAGYTADVTIDY
jgi:M6 family metalloprotease-like protein